MAKDPEEEDTIERFRSFLCSQRGITLAVTGRDVVVDAKTGENFDYQLQSQDGSKLAVELVRLVEDGPALGRQRTWNLVIQRVKEDLEKRGLKGYLIFTPPYFAVKKKDIPIFATKLANDLESAIRNSNGAERFEKDGFDFHKIRDLELISFSFSSGARSIDPHGVAATVFADKLPKKNMQVAISGHERIILVTSWAIFVDNQDAIRALSGFNFKEIENVDKIYFERTQGDFSLIFDRGIIEALKSRKNVQNPEALKLLLQYLRFQLEAKSRQAFEFVKVITAAAGSISWLDDRFAKQHLIKFGEDLLDQGDIDNALWIIRQLQNDPDPPVAGANDSEDPDGKHNLHTRVVRGEETFLITTVRGYLCWLIAKVVERNDPQYYAEMIAIIERYMHEDNLYVRVQACVPLAQLWSRRLATRNQDGSPFDWDHQQRQTIRGLALRVMRDNAAHPRVMEAILSVFSGPRDLSEDEAEEMLRHFLDTKADYVLHALAPFVIYFALFRKNDYPKDGPFNSDRFVTILKEQILGGSPSIRSSLAWHFWKLISSEDVNYRDVKEYLPLFLAAPYDHRTLSSFTLLFRELPAIAPDDAVALHREMITAIEKQLALDPGDPNISYIDGTEEIIPLLARDPDELIAMVGRLKNIWRKDGQYHVYIGSIATIFESYRFVQPERRQKTKASLRAIYEEMKAEQPNLPNVDWDG